MNPQRAPNTFRADCARIDAAKAHLANAYMNQGIDWDEACDDVDTFIARHAHGLSFDELEAKLRGEAYRYEDM